MAIGQIDRRSKTLTRRDFEELFSVLEPITFGPLNSDYYEFQEPQYVLSLVIQYEIAKAQLTLVFTAEYTSDSLYQQNPLDPYIGVALSSLVLEFKREGELVKTYETSTSQLTWDMPMELKDLQYDEVLVSADFSR